MHTLSIIVTHTLNDGSLTDNPEETRIVTRRMMRKRAIELAMSDGRSALEASKSDWEQAKQEFGG